MLRRLRQYTTKPETPGRPDSGQGYPDVLFWLCCVLGPLPLLSGTPYSATQWRVLNQHLGTELTSMVEFPVVHQGGAHRAGRAGAWPCGYLAQVASSSHLLDGALLRETLLEFLLQLLPGAQGLLDAEEVGQLL